MLIGTPGPHGRTILWLYIRRLALRCLLVYGRQPYQHTLDGTEALHSTETGRVVEHCVE